MENIIDKENIFDELKLNLLDCEDYLKSELSTIRAGRANPKILDKVVVSYYGSMTPLNQMANVSVVDARQLVVNVWDTSALKDVSKAIQEADLGLNPSDDGKIIRLSFPILTEDRRKELVKTVRKVCEETKVTARNHRRNSIELLRKMKKDSMLTEDELASGEKEVQKYLDNTTLNIDKLAQNKEKEIMEI